MDLLLDGLDGSPNTFTRFVLSNTPYSRETFLLLNAEIAKNPSLTGEILATEKYSAIFLSDFSDRIERIILWLGYLQKSETQSRCLPTNEAAIHSFGLNFIGPLLSSSYEEYHNLLGFIELVITTIQLLYDYRKRGVGPKTHKIVLEKISENPYLIRHILPSIEGAKLVQKILAEAQAGAEIRSFGSVTTVREWATVAVELCGGCRGNHRVGEELGRWDSLLRLHRSITDILRSENNKRGDLSESLLPASGFDGMRVLTMDDKKSATNTDSHSHKFTLSEEDHENLTRFNLRVPTGIGALEGIISWLEEKESFRIFQTLVNSFPCALCIRSERSQPIPKLPRKIFSKATLPNSFTRIMFGERLGPWKISLQDKAFKDLQIANKAGQLSAIARKLRELASGHWDLQSLRRPLSRRMREEAQAAERIPLWRAVYGSNGRILWQVGLGFDEDSDSKSQIIIVWRIGTSKEVRKSIRYVLRLQKAYSQEYIDKCAVDYTLVPVRPSLCGDEAHGLSGTSTQVDETITAEEEALMSNKFYHMSGKVLHRLFASPDAVEFPFDISKKEMEIVKQANTAAFILGRSGTGKTTCLLFKLLCRNIASRESGETVRQIFLTRSSFLAERLKNYLRRLIESQIEKDSIQDVPAKPQGSEDYTLTEAIDPLEGQTLDSMDTSVFPLVCTFNQLFSFLENVIRLNDRKDFSVGAGSEMNSGRAVRRLIDYNVFSSQYWSKHNEYGSKVPPADLIFAEILGIIKGSTSAERGFAPLSKDEYLSLSTKKAPVFTDDESRTYVYNMYQHYEKQKRAKGDKDDIDRVSYVLQCLEADQDLKTQVQGVFDEVYVDEIQDNKLLELDLLLTLVRNPHGIHFAGDTAQCISRDNTFRFDDIKARFFDRFISMAEKARKPDLARPELFELAQNYRSHQGILSVSADIVEMLYNGFPGQIDKLPREIGSHTGEKPTVFLGFDHKILAQGGTGIMGSEEGISFFGADQVIIVRNEAAKAHLRTLLRSALILTVFQSKGMEFEDVVLYDFFSGPLWNKLNLRNLQLLMRSETAQQLKKNKYGGLCSELKHLYVAVTRARKNLWIVESNPDPAQNMVALWTSTEYGRESLVSVVNVNDAEAINSVRRIIKPGRSTSPEAWRNQGELLLHRGWYQDALFCFQRARHKQGVVLAKAYLSYEEASAVDVGCTEGVTYSKPLYIQAAEQFEQAGFIQKAAESWDLAGEPIKAAELHKAHKEYGKAAAWYEKTREFMDAARCFQLAGLYDDAVRAYRKGEHFEELVIFMKTHQDFISKNVRIRYSTLVNLLLQRGDLRDRVPEMLLPEVVNLFGAGDEREKFYKKYEKTEDLMALYKEEQRYYDAFQLAVNKGNFEDALQLGSESVAFREGHPDSIPVTELLMLYNGMMSAHAWCVGKLHPGNTSKPSIVRGANQSLDQHMDGWKQVLDCVRRPASDFKYERPTRTPSLAEFANNFGRGILDVLELLYLKQNRNMIPQANAANELPVATMSRVTMIAGDLLAKKAPSVNLLACVGALSFTHLPAQVILLPWSPLYPRKFGHADSSLEPPERIILPIEQCYDALTEWLTSTVADVIPHALERIDSIRSSNKKAESPCFYALADHCYKSPSECTKGRHTKLTSEEVKSHILSLLEEVGLSCAPARLYYFRRLTENDSEKHLPIKRSLLEKLLKELTFVSPLLNDSGVQHEIWNMILAPDGHWVHVRDGLESLFFHRLVKSPGEGQRRGEFSGLLEERSIGSKIGVMSRFLQFLHFKNPEWRAFVEDCESLQSANISRLSAPALVDCVSRVTTKVLKWDSFQLRSFHAVLSLYEAISFELINRTIHMEILVPLSRQQFIRNPIDNSVPDDAELLDLESCLIRSLMGLCKIVSKLAKEQQKRQQTANPGPLFEVGGAGLRNANRYMIRRTLEHLALCMVNMGVGRTLPKEYEGLCEEITKASTAWGFLGPSVHVSWTLSKPDHLAYQLLNIYRKYNKDELLIIPKGRPRFQKIGFRVLRNDNIDVQKPHNVQGRSPPTGLESRKKLLAAISKIVRWWKRCRETLKQKRERASRRAYLLASGPRGQADAMINDIISRALRPRYWYQVQILKSRGKVLLAGILELSNTVDETNTKAMEGLADPRGKYKLSTAVVENIQDIIGSLQNRKRYLQKIATMFNQREETQRLLELPHEQLGSELDKSLATLKCYREQVKKWGTDIENCLSGGIVI